MDFEATKAALTAQAQQLRDNGCPHAAQRLDDAVTFIAAKQERDAAEAAAVAAAAQPETPQE